MACPAVAGLAALVASMNSTRSGMEIKQLIMDNVRVKEKYAEFVSTSGLIDVEKTIKAAAGAAPNGLLVGAGCCCALKLKAPGCAAAVEKLKPEVGC